MHHTASAYYLLLAVLVARDQVHGFHVSNVDLIAEDVGIEDFCDVSKRS